MGNANMPKPIQDYLINQFNKGFKASGFVE